MDGAASQKRNPKLPDTPGVRSFPWRAALLILLLVGLFRIAHAVLIPCIARDSVTFCWYARDLGTQGAAFLREPTTHQHPLYPLALLGVQRLYRALGAPDSPTTWQYAGQTVSWLAGVAVILLTGAVTFALTRRLSVATSPDSIHTPVSGAAPGAQHLITFPPDHLITSTAPAARHATIFTLLLAALLPLNTWLSVEPMSDELHVMCYLLGVWALLDPARLRRAALAGLAAGLAFLTRPEGAVIVAAALIAQAAAPRVTLLKRIANMAATALLFLACAAPYWLVVGTLSPKKTPFGWLGGEHSALLTPALPLAQIPAIGTALLAKLELIELPWYALVPWALYILFRAGRLIVPAIALYPFVALRRHWLRPPLIGLNACLAGHFALTVYLLARHHYLSQRHMLPLIMLLIPFAGIALARAYEFSATLRWPSIVRTLVIASFIVLGGYSLRQPNYGDRYLPQVAAWLQERDPQIAQRTLMSGSSHRRLAFYTGAQWIYWWEAPDADYLLREQLLRDHPDYFTLEFGGGYERKGNEQAIHALHLDPAIAPHILWIEKVPTEVDADVVIVRFDWPETDTRPTIDAATNEH